MENNELALIPEEVKQIELQLSEEKRSEINKILSQMFVGTSDLQKKVDAIIVKDHTDAMAMQMADAARKNIKRMRLDGVELFNQKRDAVQMAKLQYDTEDKLWLKAKQMYEISLKAIEEVAAYKADTAKRYELEQKEKMIQQRLEVINQYDQEVNRFQIENMTDQMFDVFLVGVKKAYDDRIEAERKAEEERLEKERISKLHLERKEIALAYYQFWSDLEKTLNFGEQTEDDFNSFMSRLQKSKFEYDAEQERIRVENERLKKEAEENEKKLELERQQAAKELAIAEEKARKEKEEADEKLKAEQEAARLASEKAAKEKADLEEKIRLQKEAELKAQRDKEAAELAAKKEAEKLAKAPIKKQLEVWIDSFSIPAIPITDNDVAKDIASKFNDFKNWAKKQTVNI